MRKFIRVVVGALLVVALFGAISALTGSSGSSTNQALCAGGIVQGCVLTPQTDGAVGASVYTSPTGVFGVAAYCDDGTLTVAYAVGKVAGGGIPVKQLAACPI